MTRLVADYTGRQIDLLAMDLDLTKSRSQPVGLRFADGPKFITGVQQAVQAFVSLLLTKKGSSAAVSRGTDFLTYLTTRNPRTEAQVRNYFMLSASDAMKQVNEQAISVDERIGSVVLLSANLAPGRIVLRVSLMTEAGVAASIHVPVEGV